MQSSVYPEVMSASWYHSAGTLTGDIARILPLAGGGGGGGGARCLFFEKCSLLVDRMGHTIECYIEVEQKLFSLFLH